MKPATLLASIFSLICIFGLATQPLAGGHSVVEKREAAMKTVGQSTGTIGDMLKGKTSFDAASANAALGAMRDAASGFSELYPEGSQGQTSNKYLASDKVWSDRAGFEAEITKFESAINAALTANPQDKESLGAVFGAIGGSCKSCHEGYRVQR